MAGRRVWALGAWAPAALLALAGCAAKGPAASDGWLRLAANPQAPAAAYFTLRAGPRPIVLTGVEVAHVARAELHESMAMGGHGMTGMAPMRSVAVPAGGSVAFAPGGRHVMLFGVAPAVRPGTTLAATFRLAGGQRIAGHLAVVGAGDPAPH